MHEISTRSPGFERGDARSRSFADTHPFVAEDAARLAGRYVALENVQICSANGGPGDPDDRIRGIRDDRLESIFQFLFTRPFVKKWLSCRLPFQFLVE